MIGAYGTIDLFAEKPWRNFAEERLAAIKDEIEELPKNEVLGLDQTEFCNYLQSKYELEPVEVFEESATFDEPEKEMESGVNMYRRTYQVEVYKFLITYSYNGSDELLRVIPSQRYMRSTSVYVDQNAKTISIPLRLDRMDAEKFKKQKSEDFKAAFLNLEFLNRDIPTWNRGLMVSINNLFEARKEKFQKENTFFEQINLKVDPKAKNIFVPPTVKKVVVPRPQVAAGKTFKSTPAVSEEMYEDILNLCDATGKSMENKPSLYENKGEEALRDQFLFLLETRYESVTATGETFNKGGKTDILLRHSDGSNLFVAECKFWRGPKSLSKTIDQLFDRYLTWRDSKVAILMFVDNKTISEVLESVDTVVCDHPYFLSTDGKRSASRFAFIMHLPEDENLHVQLEVQIFHYPNKS